MTEISLIVTLNNQFTSPPHRISTDTVKSGRVPVFSMVEEEYIVERHKEMTRTEYGYSRSKVVIFQQTMHSFLRRETRS